MRLSITSSNPGDKSDNWQIRKTWLLNCIAELWKNRGAYPGLPAVLSGENLNFPEAIGYFKNQTENGNERKARENIFDFLKGKISQIPGCKIAKPEVIQRNWKLKNKTDQQASRRNLSPVGHFR